MQQTRHGAIRSFLTSECARTLVQKSYAFIRGRRPQQDLPEMLQTEAG
jgi:hypothetical protein